MPRKRHVSRNYVKVDGEWSQPVMPRKRHVSRNFSCLGWQTASDDVMPRKRHVSRNYPVKKGKGQVSGHASQEACE